ncbi:MAG: DUF4910 domain-containing protein [Ruminiclostridium sp.]
MMDKSESNEMYALAEKLFPICRSITGNGVRETLQIIKEICPLLNIFEVPSGSQVFDWTIPKEWNIRDAYVEDEKGIKIIDFKNNNLHVIGYSTPVDAIMSLDELREHLYSLPEQLDLIPYVTSYYKERFGFCVSEKQRQALKPGKYHLYIDSELKNGSLTYGEIILPGESKEEVFLSTYICHPSMANNELSGPCLAIYLAKWLSQVERKRYTYRIVFVPETIGSITYLSRNLEQMKKNIAAGFVLTCLGDEGKFSYLESRYANTLADKVALNVLTFSEHEFLKYSYLTRGSDERQYCSPGVDLPVCSIMRTKYGQYPEYHTSGDDLDLISAKALGESFDVYKQCILALENNYNYKINCLCEPQLGKRGLYPTISSKNSANEVRTMMNFIAYSDGQNDLIDISNIIKVPVKDLLDIVKKLVDSELISIVS